MPQFTLFDALAPRRVQSKQDVLILYNLLYQAEHCTWCDTFKICTTTLYGYDPLLTRSLELT